jgi:hypothetical protein
VILLVVVLMLALFLVVGLSFVYYAESASTGARIYREAQAPDVADVPPETLLAFALGQVTYDNSDDINGALSAMRGHSLARTMWGWNYNPVTGTLTPDATKTNIIASETFPAANQLAALAATAPYTQANTTAFNGLGPLRTLTAPADNNGNPVNEYDLVNYTWFGSEAQQPPAYMRAAGDPPTMVRVRDPEHPAATPNLLRPDPTQPFVDTANPPKWNAPFAGGFNLPYTYADRSNMLLAAVDANIYANNGANPPSLPQPGLLLPSLVRPTATLPFSVQTNGQSNPQALQLDPNTQGGQWFWTATPNQNPPSGSPKYSSAWKYMTLRPRPGDQLSTRLGETTFPPNRPYFPPPADIGGDVKNLPGVPFYPKDQNGAFIRDASGNPIAAQNDSFWMDLNYPIQITRNGKKYKPLFAFLVLDLDGKVNLNVHGNIAANVQVQVQNQTVTYPNQHASNQGLTRDEVNLTKVLTSTIAPNSPMQEAQQLFIGTTPTPINGYPRYGAWSSTPSGMQQPVPGTFSTVAGVTNPNQYPDPFSLTGALTDPTLSNLSRSLLFPLDLDAVDPLPPQLQGNVARQVTKRFQLPMDLRYVDGTKDDTRYFASFPQFGPAGQMTTGYDNYTYDIKLDASNPQLLLNPRLNHPLLNQRLRDVNITAIAVKGAVSSATTYNDDQPLGDDNLFHTLAGDYRKSFLYGLIPYNLDGVNVPVSNPPVSNSAYGAKVRQLISTRSYDLDVPGASPWVTDPMTQGDYRLPNPNFTSVNNTTPPLYGSDPPQYPIGVGTVIGGVMTPMKTPVPSQLANQPATGDFKPGDGRASLLSRVDLARKLKPYRFYDATNPNNPLNGTVTPAQAAIATLDRQQFAKDIFDRLVKATGAVPPPPQPAPAVPPQGTLAQANGATANQYAATRYLAQLAVNIVDYIDDDDCITPFQWNPNPDPALETSQGGPLPANAGWVFGTEAPKMVLNEWYCELQNAPAERTNALTAVTGAQQPFEYAFWLELYNATPAGNPPIDPTLQTPSADRLDPDRAGFRVNPNVKHDRQAAQLERVSQTAGTYPVYEIAVIDDSRININGLLRDHTNTAGWFTPQIETQILKILTTGFVSNGIPYVPNANDPAPAYFDANYIEPTTGGYSQTNPIKTAKNQGFYLLAPDRPHDFYFDKQTEAVRNDLDPTLRLNASDKAPDQSKAAWGQATNGNAVRGLSYQSQGGKPPSSTAQFTARTHTILVRRLACPGLDPNPMVFNQQTQTWSLFDQTKPFNPYVTVDYVSKVPTNDAVKYIGGSGLANVGGGQANQQKYVNPSYQPAALRYSIGRKQPYAAQVLVDPKQYSPDTNPVHHTFFSHNIPEKAAPVASPYDWLVHIDRPPSTVMDVLLVSGFPPHLLTQQFDLPTYDAAAQTKYLPYGKLSAENLHKHLAPWTDQNARIFRALEYFTVGDRSPYPGGPGGRVAGKIDINTLFDRDIVEAFVDAQTNSNFFTQQAVTDVWQGNGNLQDPANGSFLARKQQMLSLTGAKLPDKPFMSLAPPIIPPTQANQPTVDPQYPSAVYPNGVGLQNTIAPYPITVTINNDPVSYQGGTFAPKTTPPTTNPPPPASINYTAPQYMPPRPNTKGEGDVTPPYLLDELLTKSAGHVTPRSNNFAVFVTVGFFEVIDDTTMPAKLGAELTTSGGKTIRHQMFAVVDRTNLALDAGTALPAVDPTSGQVVIPDPTGRLRQAPTPPTFMSLSDSIPAGVGAPPKQGQPPVPVLMTVQGGLPADYDGTTPVTFKPNPPPSYPPPQQPYSPPPPFTTSNSLPITTNGWPTGTYQWMFLDSGTTQEPVQVTQLLVWDNTKQAWVPDPSQRLLLLFPNGAQFSHPQGAVLCTYQPGNPGPQGPIDYNSPQYRAVVPYTYIIQ